GVLCERLRRDVDGALGFAVILEEAGDRHENNIVLALTECRPFFREYADDRVSVPAYAYDFADRRFVRKESFLYYLSNNDHASRKLHIFVVQIAAIAERVSVRGEKTSIGSNDKETRRCLYAVINSLAFHFVTKTFEANLARLAFHQSVIM